MTKLRAFATHLGISIIIFIFVVSYMIYFWYPQPFFVTDGGWQGIRIIAAVDLVLGPVLTLIVYKPNKPGLKMDLTIIGLVQASALAWGIWVTHYERPIAAIYAEGAFNSLPAKDLIRTGITNDKLMTFGERTPVWIFSDLPDSLEELQEIRLQALQSRRSLHLFSEYYKPLDQTAREKLASEKFNIELWIKDKPKAQQIYKKFIAQHEDEMDKLIILPWRARYKNLFVVVQKSDLKLVTTLDIQPPEAGEEKPEYRN